MLTDSSTISYRRALRVKMFRLFFVLALPFLLSSFASSQKKSANQVTKLITRLKVIVVKSKFEWKWEFLCFARACNFPTTPSFHNSFFDIHKHGTIMHDNETFNDSLQTSSSSSGKRGCCQVGRNNFSLVFVATVSYKELTFSSNRKIKWKIRNLFQRMDCRFNNIICYGKNR